MKKQEVEDITCAIVDLADSTAARLSPINAHAFYEELIDLLRMSEATDLINRAPEATP